MIDFATTPVPRAAARRVGVACLGLDRAPQRRARKADVLAAIRALGVLQIDTISVVARSPYLVLFSRLGAYDPKWLGEHLAEGALFEYWAHEACFVPIEDYPLLRHRMIEPGEMGWKYSHEWVAGHKQHIARVRAALEQNGPMKSSDFERRNASGGWWGWKPEKRALEMLLTCGELMVRRRENFQRVYDLRSRVLPDWDDRDMLARAEAERIMIARAAHILGIATAAWIADHYRLKTARVRAHITDLVDSGDLLPTRIEGVADEAYVHFDRAEMVASAVNGGVRCTYTTLLSPFDPLVWDRRRALALFDFDYRLECYTPAAKRKFGYFTLPVLHRGQIIGRLDAKAHRAEGRMEVRVLHLEPGVEPDERMTRELAHALVAFAHWHHTPDLAITRAVPSAYAQVLRQAVDNHANGRGSS